MKLLRVTEDTDGDVLNAGTDLVLTLFGVMTCLFACVAGREMLTRRERDEIVTSTANLTADLQAEKDRSDDLQKKLEATEQELMGKRRNLSEEHARLLALQQDVQKLRTDNELLRRSEKDLAMLLKTLTESGAAKSELLNTSEQDLASEKSARLALQQAVDQLRADNDRLRRSEKALKAQLQKTAGQGADENQVRMELVDLRGSLNRVAFVVDRSGSMNHGGRWDDIRLLLERWLNYLPVRQAVLVMYSDEAVAFPGDGGWWTMTPERRAEFVRTLNDPEYAPNGGTNTLAALKKALSYGGLETIILFTDGRPEVDGKDSETAIDEIHKYINDENDKRKQLGSGQKPVTINAIALGEYHIDRTAKRPGELPMLSFLIKLAEDTGGSFHARRPLATPPSVPNSTSLRRGRLPIRKTSP